MKLHFIGVFYWNTLVLLLILGCHNNINSNIRKDILGTWISEDETIIEITNKKYKVGNNVAWKYKLSADSVLYVYDSPFDNRSIDEPFGVKILKVKQDSLFLFDSLFSQSQILIRDVRE